MLLNRTIVSWFRKEFVREQDLGFLFFLFGNLNLIWQKWLPYEVPDRDNNLNKALQRIKLGCKYFLCIPSLLLQHHATRDASRPTLWVNKDTSMQKEERVCLWGFSSNSGPQSTHFMFTIWPSQPWTPLSHRTQSKYCIFHLSSYVRHVVGSQ